MPFLIKETNFIVAYFCAVWAIKKPRFCCTKDVEQETVKYLDTKESQDTITYNTLNICNITRLQDNDLFVTKTSIFNGHGNIVKYFVANPSRK